MDVIITCHTELGECRGNKILFTKNPVGVKKAVPNILKVVKKHNAKITFVLMPEVVKYFPKSLVKDKNIEIGLHIHPGWELWQDKTGQKWFMGDTYLWKKYKQENNSSVLIDHSYKEQYNLIKIGKKYLEKKLKIVPRVFVAGRWSENNDTIKALIKLGFTHDCTAIPSLKTSYFDWSKLPRICMPYHPSKNDYQEKGNLSLLIVPISQFWPHGGVSIDIVSRHGLGWLKACFLEYYKQAPLFHITFHSPAMSGNYFISAFDNYLEFISKYKVNFKLASEIKPYKDRKFKTNIWCYAPYLFSLLERFKR
jgi:peptidoglycan/xylan/chitin deacetylase (PgdA/CDA1 family)